MTRTLLHLLVCLVGCGYAPLRAGDRLGANRVLIMPPSEREPTGIAGGFVEELRRRMAAEGFTLARDSAVADATLTAEVVSSSTRPLATAQGADLTAFTVTVGLSARLRSRDGEVLWTGRFAESEDFFPEGGSSPTANEVLATESNQRRRALTRLTERLAAQVVRGIQRASL